VTQGGFAINAALGGAAHVTGVDSSASVRFLQLSLNHHAQHLFSAASNATDAPPLLTVLQAVALARDNAALNGLAASQCEFVEADCLDFMRAELAAGCAASYDIVVLDPPKLAPSRDALAKASGRYRRLNAAAAALVAPGGLLLSCSCSGAMTQSGGFPGLVADAARGEGRPAALLALAGAAPCHTRAVGYPEGEYLMAVLLGIS
jgi:23S rRNA G2069 N7-methylase RlmK/C1962 C5-methylase RlmI